MKPLLNLSLLALCALAWPARAGDAPAAPAAPATLWEAISNGKPLINFRLRSEHVNQDKTPSFDDSADAITLRSLIGWETLPFHGFSATVQLINVKELSDDFNDFGENRNEPGKLGYPVVADPDFTNVNQLYLDYTGIPDTRVRLGRQSVKLDNVRMVGNVEFRQVMQVFDGIALENKSLPNTDVYLAHFERVRRIDTKLYDTRIEMLNVRYKLTPTENLIGYGYWQDQPDTGQRAGAGLGANADLSNRILGVRLDGAHKLGDPWKLPYTAEYAKQDDYRGGDERIDAHYLRLGAGVGYGDWFVRVDRENLSSNDDQYAFQTPLGTNHLFQGWVDKFLTTPRHGIEDTFVTVGGKFHGVNLKGEYHWINSDEDFAKVGGGMGDSYGTEINLSADYALNKNLSGKVEYGRYREDDERAAGRIRDTRKLWLTVMYNF